MSDRDQEWTAYRAWNKDFRGPIYFQSWDQWIAEYGFAVWQASRRAALEQTRALTDEQIVAIADAQFQWGKVCYVTADRRSVVKFARALLTAARPASGGV